MYKKHLLKKYKDDDIKKQEINNKLNAIYSQNEKIKKARETEEPY